MIPTPLLITTVTASIEIKTYHFEYVQAMVISNEDSMK